MLSVVSTRLFSLLLLPLGLFVSSCGTDWSIQTPELGMHRQEVEQRFKGIAKNDLAWSFPSHEWGREGSWEVSFDDAGTVREATWHHKPDTKGMVYASYIHLLTRTVLEMGDGTNEQPTFDTYQVWQKKEARYILSLSNDSTQLYFQKVRATNALAGY